MSATEVIEEQETDPREQVERPPKDATFVARCHNLILSLFPELEEKHMGMNRKASPGYRLMFSGHNFTIDARERREFEKFLAKYGRIYAYDDEDYEEIKSRSLEEYIRAKASYGSTNPDGFYEVVPTIPEPTAELLALLDAFTAGDEDAIEDILDAEIVGHNRPKVIEAANKGLERLHLNAAEEKLRAAAGQGAPAPEAPVE